MDDILSPTQMAFEAIYLGVLTARGVKPLSRLESLVDSPALTLLAAMGLHTAEVVRLARNGASVRHLVMSRAPHLLRIYCVEFDGRLLRGETPAVIRREAHYFGYPACCAETYLRAPHLPNNLPADEQALLFHHSCPDCRVTPRLIPHYRAALAEAKQLWETETRMS